MDTFCWLLASRWLSLSSFVTDGYGEAEASVLTFNTVAHLVAAETLQSLL